MNARTLTLARLVMRIRPAPLAGLVKCLLGIRREVLDTPEGRFWTDPATYQGLCLAEHGYYEPAMVAILRQRLPVGGVFVDVGANEGYFSVIAARLAGSGGRVLAIEPQARLQPVLQRNFELNHCPQATAVAAAVSDRPGEAVLHLAPGVNNSASSLIQPTRYPLLHQRVPTARLADLMTQADIHRCDLMKIDIEGWEYEAVLGSPELFQSGRVRALVLELHPRLLALRGLDPDRIVRFLHGCGYREADGVGHYLLVRD